MPSRRQRTTKTISMTPGNDPACWRYDSAQEALSAGAALLVRLIREGECLRESDGVHAECRAVEDIPLEAASA
ncbi:MAG: hypothetical protein IPK19_26960 [Chloroflexi bacterium]|nr:hypothetical protein [Chloroflexota bacterium]